MRRPRLAASIGSSISHPSTTSSSRPLPLLATALLLRCVALSLDGALGSSGARAFSSTNRAPTPPRCCFVPSAATHYRPQTSLLLPRSSHNTALLQRTMASSSSSASPTEGPAPIPPDVGEALQTLYHSPPTADGDGKDKRQLRLCVATTGSGGHLPAWMLGTAGASAVLLELSVPYSEGATLEYLQPPGDGKRGDWGYCSAGAARELAEAAYHRAVGLTLRSSSSGDTLPQLLSQSAFVGVACTAAVASGVPKKGAHRAHVCIYTRGDDGRPRVESYHLELTKGARSRLEEDYAVSKATLAALLQATHPSPNPWLQRLPLGGGTDATADRALPITAPQDNEAPSFDALDSLAQGQVDRALFVPTPGASALRAFPFPPGVFLPLTSKEGAAPTIVYPGSFNPLHDGHIALAHAAQALVAGVETSSQSPPTVLYEIATVNADKGAIDRRTLEARLPQFGEKGEAVVLTRTPLFVEKARLFPGAYFLIGADTVKRLLDPKYYNNDRERMVLALSEILHLGCKFVVGGRVTAEGEFVTLESVLEQAVPIPESLRAMFHGLSEAEFRVDLSSTEIRARLAAAAKEKGV